MELDRVMHKVQSILKKEERLLGTLNSRTYNKECEEDISKVVISLERCIDYEQLNDKAKQKLYILLCINTDSDLYNDLKKNRKYAHLVGFFPKLNKDLFMKIVVVLNLQEYLYMSLLHSCSALSYQVLDACINALNWLDLFEAVEFVENILAYLFKKIVVMDETDKYNAHIKDIFQRLLLHYEPEKGGTVRRMRLWEKTKMKHYAGLVVASLISLLERCTKIYCKREEESKSSDCSLYKIQLGIDSVTLKSIVSTENRLITVQHCYEHVMSKCLENISSVNIDIWLFWVEIDLDDLPDTENTLQRLIGEKAYTCRETLKEAECLGVSSKETSELISKLKSISLKPHIEDATSSLDLDQVITNIQDKNKDTKQWLKFLLSNPSFVVELPALEIIKSHITYLQTTDAIKLSKCLCKFIKTSESCDRHKTLFLEIVKSLDIDIQIEISKGFVEVFGLTDILKTEEFQSSFVEVFNKVINEEDKEKELYPQFMSLALQNAESVISRAVAEGITSEVRGHLMADILSKLQAFCDTLKDDGNPLLVTVLGELLLTLPDLPENYRANFPLFVRELVMRKNMDGDLFIKGCIMVQLHRRMKSKNWIVLIACLETLSELYDVDCFHNCPASIFMLLQVVQTNRWKPTTFHSDAVHLCSLALQLISQLITKWFDITFELRELQNLTELVKQYICPVNRYHLYRLLSEEPLPDDPAQQLIYRMHYGIGEWSVLQITSDQRVKLLYSLCYVLPVLTSNEWNDLFCVVAPKCSEFLCLFHIVTDSIIICLESAKVNIDPTVMNCLVTTVINIIESVEYEMKRWNENDNEYRISVLKKLCQLVSNFPIPDQKALGLTMIKTLVQLLPEDSRRKPLTDDQINSVTASIACIQADNVRQNLAKEFLEMIHR